MCPRKVGYHLDDCVHNFNCECHQISRHCAESRSCGDWHPGGGIVIDNSSCGSVGSKNLIVVLPDSQGRDY